jgi:hypothetical protein
MCTYIHTCTHAYTEFTASAGYSRMQSTYIQIHIHTYIRSFSKTLSNTARIHCCSNAYIYTHIHINTQVQQDIVKLSTLTLVSNCISKRYIINVTDIDMLKRIGYKTSGQNSNESSSDEDADSAYVFEPQIIAPILGSHSGYVCMYVCIKKYVHMYVCIHEFVYICMYYTWTHTYIHANMHDSSLVGTIHMYRGRHMIYTYIPYIHTY